MIKIITDSTSDLNEKYVLENDIEVVPLEISIGNETYLDGVNLSKAEFYAMQKANEKDFPKTSMINEFRFTETLKKFEKEYDEFLVITLASELSGTYNSAVSASKNFPNKKISVIDSRQVSIGLNLMVRMIVEMNKENKTLQEITEFTNNIAPRVRSISVFDTLKYLKVGGRISGFAAIIGELIGIKPIVKAKQGKILSAGKVKGKKMGMRHVFREFDMKADREFPFVVGYSQDYTTVEAFQTEYTDKLYLKEYPIEEVGVSVGAYSGENAFSIAYVKKD